MKELISTLPKVSDIVYLISLNDPMENINLHFPGRLFGKNAVSIDRYNNLMSINNILNTGTWDMTNTIVGPNGEIHVIPTIDQNTSLYGRVTSKCDEIAQSKSYFFTLVKIVLNSFLNSSKDVQQIQEQFPYLSIKYINSSDGSMYPLADAVWEDHTYTMLVLEKLLELMNNEAKERNIRFYLVYPLTMPEAIY